jgi:cold-inducible RNA-binding protein
MKLFVGNLAFSSTENDLEDLFSEYGTVTEVGLVTDRATGRSRGFAFVTMGNDTEAQAAITALDGKEFGGRNIAVNEARPKTDAPRGGGGGSRQNTFSRPRR